jgi:hypothetical protein
MSLTFLAQWTLAGDQQAADSNSTPQKKGFFSSLSSAVRQGFDPKAVRGYFDQGGIRYYCLTDTKTGEVVPNAVMGTTTPEPNGHLSFHQTGVSAISCDDIERSGKLVLQSSQKSQGAATPSQLQQNAEGQSARGGSTLASTTTNDLARFEVAGLRLGAPPDEIRRTLKAKRLQEYDEGTATLSFDDQIHGPNHRTPIPNGHFLNVIATATFAVDHQVGSGIFVDSDWFEVHFSPLPGSEQAIEIVRTVSYSPEHAIRETALIDELKRKYGEPSNELKYAGHVQSRGLSTHGFIWITGTSADLCKHFAAPSLEQVDDDATYGPRDFQSVLGHDSPNAATNVAFVIPVVWQRLQACGSLVLTVSWITRNSDAPAEQHVVAKMQVAASALQLGKQAAFAAAQMIKQAERVSNENASKASAENKPDL